MTCTKCGSDQVQEFSAEMAFGGGMKSPPIYFLSKAVCCLNCGLAQFSIPEDSLNELRESAAAQPKTTTRLPSKRDVA
jgi:hypothetical protein